MQNQKYEEPIRNRRCREPIHDQSRQDREPEPGPKRPQPRPERFVPSRPPRGEPTSGDLEWEVDEHSDSEVLFAQAFFHKLEGGDGFVGGEADLGTEVDEENGLDV